MADFNINFNDIPIYDHHAHPLSNILPIKSPEKFYCWFTESNQNEVITNNVHETLFLKSSLKWFAEFYGCSPDINSILDSRSAYSNEKLINKFFTEIKIKKILVDYDLTGLPKPYSLKEISSITNSEVEGILRIETLLERLINKHSKFDMVIDEFNSTLTKQIENNNIKALKSIAAYRTGLQINLSSKDLVNSEFINFKNKNISRLDNKIIIDFFVNIALNITEKYSFPIQFHTGFGDNDVYLRLADPLYLTPLIKKHQNTKFIILHSGWPYHKNTAYLASVYKNVWIDLSLMIPFATTAIEPALREILGFTPLNKILFATDAFAIPEIFWLAVKWGRNSINNELSYLYKSNLLNYHEVEHAAEMILYKNSELIYEK